MIKVRVIVVVIVGFHLVTVIVKVAVLVLVVKVGLELREVEVGKSMRNNRCCSMSSCTVRKMQCTV